VGLLGYGSSVAYQQVATLSTVPWAGGEGGVGSEGTDSVTAVCPPAGPYAWGSEGSEPERGGAAAGAVLRGLLRLSLRGLRLSQSLLSAPLHWGTLLSAPLHCLSPSGLQGF
jgi:hypothetical protein